MPSLSVMFSTYDQEANTGACLRKVLWSGFGEMRKDALDRATETLKHDLTYDVDRDLNHYSKKFERHAALASGDLFQRGWRIRFSDLTLPPSAQFVRLSVLKAGFLVGLQGLVLSGLSGYILTTYIELWELGIRLPGEGGAST